MNHDLTVIYCTIVEDLHVSIKHSSHMEYFNVAFCLFLDLDSCEKELCEGSSKEKTAYEFDM